MGALSQLQLCNRLPYAWSAVDMGKYGKSDFIRNLNSIWSTYELFTFYLFIFERKENLSDDGFYVNFIWSVSNNVQKNIKKKCWFDTMQRCFGMKNDDIEMCICKKWFQPLQFSWLNERQRIRDKQKYRWLRETKEMSICLNEKKTGKKISMKSEWLGLAKWAQENRFE